MHDWIRLHSGKKFHFLNPKVSEITIEDIAHNLSHICRFTGAVNKFYSVAQHCCLVCDILPDEFKPEGLLHDGPESAISDVNSVLKSLLPEYRVVEMRIEKMFARKFKLRFPFPPEVKVADLTLLSTEMRDLMPGHDYENIPYEPLAKIIIPWTIEKSRKEFLKRFHKLYKS